MSEPKLHIVTANGLRMHVAEQGKGPLVLLCHGFPESWHSWRHQLRALADAGFRAVAPSMRGYGETERPTAIDQYTLLHLVGDMVGLLDALDAETAVIAGHDWGAPVAWHAALLRPDRFRGVIGLSIPYIPRGQVYPSRDVPDAVDKIFYQRYFQAPGVAEKDLEANVRLTVQCTLSDAGGQPAPGAGQDQVLMLPREGGFGALFAGGPPPLPSWLTQADVDFYVAQFERTGFSGGLNWYRNIDRNWELLAAFDGARITVPALYIVGERDVCRAFVGMDKIEADLARRVPNLRDIVVLPGCGHWTQQERPNEVSEAMIGFLRRL